MSNLTDVVKTTIVFEVLHHKDLPVGQMSFEGIICETTDGEASGREISMDTSNPLTVEELNKLCEVHGTDTEFFRQQEDDCESDEETFDTGDFDE